MNATNRLIFGFFSVLFVLIVGVILFLQSEWVANKAQIFITERLPKNLGIDAKFNRFSIQIFPPGIALVDPSVVVHSENALNLSAGSEIEAARLEFLFKPIQAFTGHISVHQIRIVRGWVRTAFESPDKVKKRPSHRFSLDSLFQIRVESIAAENSEFILGMPDAGLSIQLQAKKLYVGRDYRGGEASVSIQAIIENLKLLGDLPKGVPDSFEHLEVAGNISQSKVSLDQLELESLGSKLVTSGVIQADIFEGKALPAKLQVLIKSNLALLDKRVAGQFTFDGRVEGDLSLGQKALNVDGRASIDDMKGFGFAFRNVATQLKYVGQNNKLSLDKSRIEMIDKDQAMGSIALSPMTLNLDHLSSQEISLEVQHNNTSFSEIEGPIKGDLKGLSGKITGTSSVTIKASSKLEVRGAVNWHLNQVALQAGATQIFNIREPTLKAKFEYLGDTLFISDVHALFKDSSIEGQGQIRFQSAAPKTYFNFDLDTKLNLSFMKEVAEIPIEGAARLNLKIEGPGTDTKLRFSGSYDALKVLNIDIGQARGAIELGIKDAYLKIEPTQIDNGFSQMGMSGRFDFGEHPNIALEGMISRGNISDVYRVLKHYLSPFWWYPEQLTGFTQARFKLQGGPKFEAMKIDFDFRGDSWDFFGERFQDVVVQGTYDHGDYSFHELKARKRRGQIAGNFKYSKLGVWDWDLHALNLSLSDLDRVARLNVPIRGAIDFDSAGSGIYPKLESKTKFGVNSANLLGRSLPDSSATVELSGGHLKADAKIFGAQSALKIDYGLVDGTDSFIDIRADHFDLVPPLIILNPSLQKYDNLQAQMSGSYLLKFLSGQAEVGSGKLILSDFFVYFQDTKVSLGTGWETIIDKGSSQPKPLELYSDRGKLKVELGTEDGELFGDIMGIVDMSLLQLITPEISQSSGNIELKLAAAGSVKQPQLSGSVLVSDGLIRVPSLDTPFEGVKATIDVEDGELEVESFESDLAGGRVYGSGFVQLSWSKPPDFNLEAELSGSKLKVFPFQVMKARGNLSLKGKSRPYKVAGQIWIDSAVSKEKVLTGRSSAAALRTTPFGPPTDAFGKIQHAIAELNVHVVAPQGVIVQNEILDVEAKADLKLVGTLENPRPLGEVKVIQGKLLFKDRAFILQSGRMEFDRETQLNPKFEMLGTTEISNRKITIFASGRLDRPRVEFTSNPAMNETEILTLLALGFTNEDVAYARVRNTDRSAYQQGEAASLVLHSLDFNREVANKTGFQIGLDEAVNTQQGQSAFRPRSQTDPNAVAPKIVIRRQIGKRVDVSVGSTVGVGNTISREVSAQVRLTPGFAVQGVWNSFEGANTDQNRRNSYGLDLKVQKRFK